MLSKTNVRMGRPSTLHEPITKIIMVERGRLDEFALLCREKGISVSEGMRQLVEQELEKNAIGESNPIRIRYGLEENKPFQTDLTPWLEHVDTVTEQNELNKIKGQALEIARRSDKRSMELRFNDLKR